MRKQTVIGAVVSLLLAAGAANADVFGTGASQFTIDFVPISGITNPTSGHGIVNRDYRMGTYDVTNDQWNKFVASLGVPVTGADGGYSSSSHFTGTNVPVNNVSWYEAAQFVNWLNTSTGHQAAYKFTGTQGTYEYTFDMWSPTEAANNGTNPYRNKDAFYYLPTYDEWVKAAYWNSTTLQTYATKGGAPPIEGIDSNYGDGVEPWNVGSGSQELNGTYDMMGNVFQWAESPYVEYETYSPRVLSGGSYATILSYLWSSSWVLDAPDDEYYGYGFRVASDVPEPATLSLLALGGLALVRRRQ